MDRYRIKFVCHTEPDNNSRLEGFKLNKEYEGRHFNGLYEISTQWGVAETRIIGERVFSQFFEKVEIKENILKQPA